MIIYSWSLANSFAQSAEKIISILSLLQLYNQASVWRTMSAWYMVGFWWWKVVFRLQPTEHKSPVFFQEHNVEPILQCYMAMCQTHWLQMKTGFLKAVFCCNYAHLYR